jgi:hypothetical protein
VNRLIPFRGSKEDGKPGRRGRLRLPLWVRRIRWIRVAVILFCLAFWIGVGFGCQRLLQAWG